MIPQDYKHDGVLFEMFFFSFSSVEKVLQGVTTLKHWVVIDKCQWRKVASLYYLTTSKEKL